MTSLTLARPLAGERGLLGLVFLAWSFLAAATAATYWPRFAGQGDAAYVPWLALGALWLFLRRLPAIRLQPQADGRALAGLLPAGLAYAIGRSQAVDLLEFGGAIGLLAGGLRLVGGPAVIRQWRFALLFLLFLVPYPGWLVDSITQPLKLWISAAAEEIFYFAGYPVARTGVLISLGPYRLLVADACSGLHSLIFLSALGLVCLHLTPGRPAGQRILLALLLLPIAVLANLIRVLLLLLVTYHLGDAWGQSFWHDIAGLVLFVSAFGLLLGADRLLARRAPAATSGTPARSTATMPSISRRTSGPGRALAFATFCLLVLAAAQALKPVDWQAASRPVIDLGRLVPAGFGAWQRYDGADQAVVAPDLAASVDRLYSQTLSRTYINAGGDRVMLSIAYGGHQLGNALQAHRPEFCYRAQGFSLLDLAEAGIVLPGQVLDVRRLVARQQVRNEPVTYWMTVGDQAVLPGIRRKLGQLRHGLQGVIPDGMLIRVSSIDPDNERAFALQAAFIADLQRALPGQLGFVADPRR